MYEPVLRALPGKVLCSHVPYITIIIADKTGQLSIEYGTPYSHQVRRYK